MLVSCETIATKNRTLPPARGVGFPVPTAGDSVKGRVALFNEEEGVTASSRPAGALRRPAGGCYNR